VDRPVPPDEATRYRRLLIGASGIIALLFLVSLTAAAVVIIRAKIHHKKLYTVIMTLEKEVQDRRSAEEILLWRARADMIMSNISKILLDKDVDEVVHTGMEALSEILEYDQMDIIMVDEGGNSFSMIYEWHRDDVDLPFDTEELMNEFRHVPFSEFPWLIDTLMAGEWISIPDPSELPPEAVGMRRLMTRRPQDQCFPSNLFVPILHRETVIGAIEVESFGNAKHWKPEEIDILRRFGEVVAIALDRHSREEALRESERKFRETADLLPQTVYELDMRGQVTFINKTGLDLLGYTSEEVEAGFNGLDAFVPEDRERALKNIMGRLHGEDRGANEYTALCKDGRRVPVMIYGTPIIRDGRPVGTRGVIVDITERKMAEERLRAAMETAEKARAEAEAATRAKSEFLANMSHEIRTPMNAIVGMADLARRREVSPKVREYLDIIDSSAKSLLGLINDILDFSKIEAGKIEIEDTAFYLTDILERMSDLFRGKTSDKGIELVTRIEPGTPMALRGDPLRIGQILTNLVSNAVKFTDGGEIILSVTCLERDEAHARLELSVRDTGIGIPEEKLDRLFDSFSQLDGSTTRRFGGTGLGLAICKSLTELMGGEISAESEYGVGSTFRVRLDLARQAPEEERRRIVPRESMEEDGSAVAVKALQGSTILLVEDNLINQRVALEIFKENGIHADVASNGREAVAAIRAGSYDAVLMDVQMPEMDGYEATRILRRSPEFDDLPIIAMTANAMKGDKEKCLDAGMNDYVAKPIDTDELFLKLHTWLRS